MTHNINFKNWLVKVCYRWHHMYDHHILSTSEFFWWEDQIKLVTCLSQIDQSWLILINVLDKLPTRNWLLFDKHPTRNWLIFYWNLINALSKSCQLIDKAQLVIFFSFWQLLDNAVVTHFFQCNFFVDDSGKDINCICLVYGNWNFFDFTWRYSWDQKCIYFCIYVMMS